MGISESRSPRIGRGADHLWKQFWRIFPWCKSLAHSVACRCFRLPIVNRELRIELFFLLPPPTYWSSTAASLCLWGKSAVWGKRQRGLTEKAQVCFQTDLHGSTIYQLCEPRASFSGRRKMEPKNPVLQGCFSWEDKWKLPVKRWALCLVRQVLNEW